jgi:chromosome segregation ATPase
MTDEEKESQLDADIMQSRADIEEALRAAGKPILSELPIEFVPPPVSSPHDTVFDLDLTILENENTAPTPSAITEMPAPASTKEPVGPADSQRVQDSENARLRQELQQANAHLANLRDENRQLRIDQEESRKASAQTGRLRHELSETEITLSQERSKIRTLRAALGDMENQQRSLAQERRNLAEQIQQYQQEIHQQAGELDRTRAEHAMYQERTGREMADLNQQVERLTGDRQTLKETCNRLRHEYETCQAQAAEEAAHLTDQLDELRKADDGLRQTIRRLNEEILAAKAKADQLPEMTQKLETLQAQLAQTQELLRQERLSDSALNQEIERLRAVALEHEHLKETLQSHIQQYKQTHQEELHAESVVLREQFEQERRILAEQIDQARQEKQKLTEEIERLGAEQSDYQEHADRRMADLTQQIEHLTDDRSRLQQEYDRQHHEYEAYQTQADGQIAHLTDQLDELRTGDDGLRQTIRRLNEEIMAANTKAQQLAEIMQKLETVQAELTQTRELLVQERQTGITHKQEIERLKASVTEQERLKETLQSQFQMQQAHERTLLAESAVLREQFEQERLTLAGQLEQALLEKQRIQNGFEKLRSEYLEYRNQISEKTAELQRQIDQLMKDYQTLKAAHEQTLAVVHERNDLRVRLKEFLTRQDELTAELTAVQNQLHQAQEAHKDQLKAVQKQYRDALSQNEHHKEELSVLQTQLEQAAQNARHYRHKAEQFDAVQAFLQEARQDLELVQDEITPVQEERIPSQAHPETTFAQPQAVSQDELAPRPDETMDAAETDAVPSIPAFNLAEQILAEHRRSVSSRRQRIKPAETAVKHEAIRQVVQYYVQTVAVPSEADHRPIELAAASANDASLSPFQRELLEEIIQRDIELLSEKSYHRKAFLMTS